MTVKIIKKTIKNDRNTSITKHIFDEMLLTALNRRNEFFDKMEVTFSDKDIIEIDKEKKKAILSINCYNELINDGKMLSIHVLRMILFLYSKIEYDDELLQELRVNRQVIKMGFEDALFSYLYRKVVMTKVENYEDYVSVNTSWISYHDQDSFYEEFLKKTIDKLHKRKGYQSRFKKKHYIKKLEQMV